MATRTDPQNDRIELRTHAEDAGTAQIHAPHWSGTFWSGRAGDRRPGQSRAAPPDPHEDARRGRIPQPLWDPLALQVPRETPVYLHSGRPGIPGGLPAGGVGQWDVRRELQLAGTDLGAGEHPHHPGAPAVLPVLRRQLENRMPYGV